MSIFVRNEKKGVAPPCKRPLPRMRFWRGHGIHSPFMYALVRKVFMKRRITGGDTGLYLALRERGVGKRSAVVLQNMFTHCDRESYTILGEQGAKSTACKTEKEHKTGESGKDRDPGKERRNLCILLPTAAPELIERQMRVCSEKQGVLAVPAPLRHKAVRETTLRAAWEYHCVSVDRRDMILCFFDSALQKQHYRI